MTSEELRALCLSKRGAYEDYPFGPDTAVFKVMDKLFALCGLNNDPLSVNLKCETELSELLRQKYEAITPGYHMNKRPWNTLVVKKKKSERESLVCKNG